MYGVNKFSGEGQGKIHHVVVADEKSNTIVEEKMVTNEKVTPSEEVDKDNKRLDDMEEAVVIMCRKDLNKFYGKSIGSTGWFNLDHKWSKRK